MTSLISRFGKHDLWSDGWVASWKTGQRIAGNASLPDCKAALSTPPLWFGHSQTDLNTKLGNTSSALVGRARIQNYIENLRNLSEKNGVDFDKCKLLHFGSIIDCRNARRGITV